MNDLNRIRETIRRCLAVAENDASADAEIEQAVRIAASLMAKHNLEREDCIDAAGNVRAGRLSYGRYFASGSGSFRVAWEAILASVVADIVGTVKIYSDRTPRMLKERGEFVTDRTGNPKLAKAYVFYGPDDDAKFSAEMYEELRLGITALSLMKYGGYAKGDGATYCQGYVEGVRETHVQEMKRLQECDVATKALIVRSQSTALSLRKEADSWLAKTYGIRLSRGSGLGGSNGCCSARNAGRQDGRSSTLPGRRAAQARLR